MPATPHQLARMLSGAHPVSLDRRMLWRATLAALRGIGHVEPNPLVGCIIGVRASEHHADAIGIGHHQRFAGPHAEVNAIANARARGFADRLRGSTAWVTLEPCNHTGKTPPCTMALIEAGIGEVVIARRDPNRLASGGAETLERAGILVRLTDACPAAIHLSDPFITALSRASTPRPWLIAKWAQTLDGKVATATGSSQWITGPLARHRVHGLRAKVDAIITGIGTVRHDNPMLTARGVPIRRHATRVLIDPFCELPTDSALARTASQTPTLVCCANDHADAARAETLRALGCAIVPLPTSPGGNPEHLDLFALLARLFNEYAVHTALLEAGPTLLSAAFEHDLVDEAWAFIAPKVLGDSSAPAFAAWRALDSIAEACPLKPIAVRRCAQDTLLVLRRANQGDRFPEPDPLLPR